MQLNLKNGIKMAGGMVACLIALTVSANPINITVDGSGNLLNGVGAADKAQYKALTGVHDNSPTSNFNFLNDEIGLWNGAALAPTLTSANIIGNLDLGDSSDFTTSGGTFMVNPSKGSGNFDYVVFHFGAGQAGGKGWWEAFYLGGADINTLTFTIPVINSNSAGGISSARFFNDPPVPDGGTTALLLGLAISALGLIHRKMS